MDISNSPLIALTMGDPAGVGPEIIVQALARQELRAVARYVVIGNAPVVSRAAGITGSNCAVETIEDLKDLGADPAKIYVLKSGSGVITDFPFGELSAAGGRAAFRAIDLAIGLALGRQVDAVATAPINKEALRLAGIPYAGHTEIFAEKTGTRDYAMMLVHDAFRVVHVSTHVSLRQACDAVTAERVLRVIRLAHSALKRIGVSSPRIAVAGLNPHAGENGLFGSEEIDDIAPAIKSARSGGIDARGPFPPDTIFAKAAAGDYDCVVAMYHDQGHVPVKMVGFAFDRTSGALTNVRGINVTLGLPVIRTSVDHGTAFDVAGKGLANDESMVEAMRYAALLARSEDSTSQEGR